MLPDIRAYDRMEVAHSLIIKTKDKILDLLSSHVDASRTACLSLKAGFVGRWGFLPDIISPSPSGHYHYNLSQLCPYFLSIIDQCFLCYHCKLSRIWKKDRRHFWHETLRFEGLLQEVVKGKVFSWMGNLLSSQDKTSSMQGTPQSTVCVQTTISRGSVVIPWSKRGTIFIYLFLTLKEQTVFCLPVLKRGQVRWLVPAGSSATCCVEGLPKVQHCLWTAEDKSSSSMAGSSGMLGISWWQMTDPQTAVSQFMALVRSLEQNTSPLHYPGPSLRAFAEGKYMQKVFLVWFL